MVLNAIDPALLVCPQCRDGPAPLARIESRLECARCRTTYPVVNCKGTEVPWLFADPDSAFMQWHDRLISLQTQLQQQSSAHSEHAKCGTLSSATLQRLRHLRDAHRAYSSQLVSLLEPFPLRRYACENAQRKQLMRSQAVTSNIANVFRDWAWQTGEVDATRQILARLLKEADVDELGKLLTLGCGPGALTYLLENTIPVSTSVKFDINPLFAAIDAAMFRSESIDLYEFPIAPVDVAETAVLRHCHISNASLDCPIDNEPQRVFIVGDLTDMPFADAAFDSVLTPWLIDILPAPLDKWIATINRLLPVGGIWLNTGSLNFSGDDPRFNYTPTEVLKLLVKYGFEVSAHSSTEIPYLQSPASAHQRRERVFSFCATKTSNTQPVLDAQYRQAQDWQVDLQTPIPLKPQLRHAGSHHLLRAQILGAVDGERSVLDIARAIAKKYDLALDVSISTVTNVLDEHA